MWVSVAVNSVFCKKRYVSSVFFKLISSLGRYEVSNLAESENLIFLIMLVSRVFGHLFQFYCFKFSLVQKRALNIRYVWVINT